MALAVLRVAPVKARDLASMSKHHTRDHSATDAHIDRDRSHLNQVLIGTGDPAADVERIARDYKLAKQSSNPTIAAEVILTAGKQYFDQQFPNWRDDPKALDPWVKAQMDFLKTNEPTVGKAASVVLHLDEDAPHLHIVTVPIANVRVKNRHSDRTEQKISYSALFGDSPSTLARARQNGTVATDTKLGRLQTTYANAMQQHGLDLERGASNTGRKHIAPKEFRKMMAIQTPDIEITPLSKIDKPKKLNTITERLKAARDIAIEGDNAPILRQHHEIERKLANEAINRGKLIPDHEKMKALEREVSILNIENNNLKRQVKYLSENRDAIAEELRQNKELMQEFRGLSEHDLIREKLATKDEIEEFKKQSGRSKFNAIDFIMHRDNCDFKSAIFTIAETFTPEQVEKTAKEKKALDVLPDVHKTIEEVGKTARNYFDEIDTDLSRTVSKEIKTPATKAKEINVKQQTDAIGAGLYRITLMSKDPKQPSFNLGKGNDGAPEKFYTAKEVMELIPTLSYRNAKGYNIFITPMPDDERRFILLDDIKDMNRAKELKPALILQTSPKSAQALYIVDGTKSKEATNKLFRDLNEQIGDPKINGLIHPMRLAGFTNRKPSYEENGRFPFVKILEANGAISEPCNSMIDEIMRHYELEEMMPTISKPKQKASTKHWFGRTANVEQINVNNAKQWYRDQISYWGEKADISKMDRKLAVFMSQNGYTETETRDTILSSSPDIMSRHPDIDRYLEGKTGDLNFTPEPEGGNIISSSIELGNT